MWDWSIVLRGLTLWACGRCRNSGLRYLSFDASMLSFPHISTSDENVEKNNAKWNECCSSDQQMMMTTERLPWRHRVALPTCLQLSRPRKWTAARGRRKPPTSKGLRSVYRRKYDSIFLSFSSPFLTYFLPFSHSPFLTLKPYFLVGLLSVQQVDEVDEGFVAEDDGDLPSSKPSSRSSDADSLSPISDSLASPLMRVAKLSPTDTPSPNVDGGILEDGCGFEEMDEEAKVKDFVTRVSLSKDSGIHRCGAWECFVNWTCFLYNLANIRKKHCYDRNRFLSLDPFSRALILFRQPWSFFTSLDPFS